MELDTDSIPAAPRTSSSDAADKDASTPSHSRSRSGCWTCREKKVKCDEERPQCRRCVRLGRVCDYEPRARKPYPRRRAPPQKSQQQQQHQAPRPALHSDASSEPLTAHRSPLSTAGTTPGSILGSVPRSIPGGALTSPSVPPAAVSAGRPWVSDACAVILEPADYDAIHNFRFVVGPSADRKPPELSVAATIWKMAQNDEMLLHMVCAMGGHHLAYKHQTITIDPEAQKVRAVEHYGASLHLLALATAQDRGGTVELDHILATLWLMIHYEQRFGDGSGAGLSAHLSGAASFIQGRLHNLRNILENNADQFWGIDQGASPQPIVNHDDWLISGFACRMVVWIAFRDGAAALNGFGGLFNEMLSQAMVGIAEDEETSLVEGFDALHRHANCKLTEDWNHPQERLLDDLHSRATFYLFGNTGQVRFLLSKLVGLRDSGSQAFEVARQKVVRIMGMITDRYAELIGLAHTLQLDPSSPHRTFIINVRGIVAHYHASVLCYFRIIRRGTSLNRRQSVALGRILNIAHQMYIDEGDSSFTRIGWPLFVAALESDDALHRAWIMERYQRLAEEGENFRRAYESLKYVFTLQRYHERRVDLFDLLHNNQLSRFLV
ncbi:uncharacterized protein E0L32_003392 [Thyridium curvatum]|uniref:Zn(2)-C6 fungal-type domain-containing protein n=1 Tax=Thyridium curvatum TaxID=1093900 RepID=A0A507BJN2_9PEZI|nr:uncharacterized protein E0L32_003392 [Thyridium curvatum]TPX16830.1 hypothetical protein E0L32_003392 [Thyridium curvatum]